MNQGFAIAGGLIFLLLHHFFSFGDAVFIYLLALGGLLFVGNRLGWFAPSANEEDAAPDVPPDPRLVERIRFNSDGLRFVGRQNGKWYWQDAGGLRLVLGSCNGSLGPVESDPDVVSYCRELIDFNSSLVEARRLESTTVRGIVCVMKGDRRPGYVYAGRLHVLLEHQTVIFFLVADEQGHTGVREAVVTTEALRAGVIEIDAGAGKVKHWLTPARSAASPTTRAMTYGSPTTRWRGSGGSSVRSKRHSRFFRPGCLRPIPGHVTTRSPM